MLELELSREHTRGIFFYEQKPMPLLLNVVEDYALF